MWPVASFPQSFPKTFFGKPQSSLLTGSRSCQVSNGIKGSNATDYAGLRLDCAGVPAMQRLFFHKVQKNHNKANEILARYNQEIPL